MGGVPFPLGALTSLFRNSVRFALKMLSSPMPQIWLCESSIVSNSVEPDLQRQKGKRDEERGKGVS